MMNVGYICLGPSYDDALPTTHRQLLHEAGCTAIFADTTEDEVRRRTQLAEAVSVLNGSGILTVTRLSHLGGSVTEAVWTLCRLDSRGIRIRSLQPCVDTAYPSGQLLVRAFRELTHTFCSAAPTTPADRVPLPEPRRGRRPVLTQAEVEAARAELENGARITDVARRYGVSRWTIARLRRFDGNA